VTRLAWSINRSPLSAKFGMQIAKNARSQGGPDSPVPGNGLGRGNRRQKGKRRRICKPTPALELSWAPNKQPCPTSFGTESR
jgi:hypothetical protein